MSSVMAEMVIPLFKNACNEVCAEQNELWADCRTGISGQDEAMLVG